MGEPGRKKKSRSGRVKEARITTFMLVEQLSPEYFSGWTDMELDTIKIAKDTDDLRPLTEVLSGRVTAAGISLKEMYGIIHDKDSGRIWSELDCSYIMEIKPIHAHWVGKVPAGIMLGTLAKVLGVRPQAIERPKRGNNSYDNMLAYLIHAKDETKAQYKPQKVVSVGQVEKPMYKQYMEIYAERKEEWIKGRDKKTAKLAAEDLDSLLAKILHGEVTRAQVNLTDEYFAIYARHSRQCDDAFRVYGDRRAYKTLEALESGNCRLSVFFITGQTGAGKTRLAKRFVESLIKASIGYSDKWRVCQTAASNPMDDYEGEEILFMDDVRGSAMSASDWLKLLDPYNNGPASARYKNKRPACRVIVITSTKEPIEFFYYCRVMGSGDGSEALDQFLRRIQCLTRVIKADDFMDTRAMIGEGRSCIPYSLPSPGNPDDTLKLTYDFGGNKRSVPFNEAVNEMMDIARNNGSLSDSVN